MNKRILLTTVIALGTTSVISSQTTVLSVLAKNENINKKNVSEDTTITKIKTSQGPNTSLVVLKDAFGNQWIESWGNSGNNEGTDGVFLGRQYYKNDDSQPGPTDLEDYYFSPGEIFFTPAGATEPLQRGEYTVVDTYISPSNTGMAVLRYSDNGNGQVDKSNSSPLRDHIFVWGAASTKPVNDNYGIMGDGADQTPHQIPVMLTADMKTDDTFSLSTEPFGNLIDVLESGQDVGPGENDQFHVQKLFNSAQIASNFLVINNSTVNADGTLNDDYTQQRFFSWGLNNLGQALNTHTKPESEGGIDFPNVIDEFNYDVDGVSTPVVDNYDIIDFQSGGYGGIVQVMPKGISYDEHPEESRLWVFGSARTFLSPTNSKYGYTDMGLFHQPTGGNQSIRGFLDELIEPGEFVDAETGVDFFDVLNDPNTYIESFDISGSFTLIGLYNGLNDKHEIYFNGINNSGLGFTTSTTNTAQYDPHWDDLNHWENISSYFDPLVNNIETDVNSYKIKRVVLTKDSYTDFENWNQGSTTAVAVFTDELGNDEIYMWGSNSGNALMGNNGESDAYVGDVSDGSERAINTTTYFPSYDKGDMFVVNDLFISTSFVTIFVNERGENKIYNWGDNSKGQFGIGKPGTGDGEVLMSSLVPYLNDRTPTISFQVLNPTKNSIDLKYKIRKFAGIELRNPDGETTDTSQIDSVILRGSGLTNGSVSLIDDSTEIRNGETAWLTISDPSFSSLPQGEVFNDWEVEMTYVDTFSQTPDEKIESTFKVPSFSTSKDLEINNETIAEKIATEDITSADSSETILNGERYLEINATIVNQNNTPISEEMFKNTKIYADENSERYGVQQHLHEQLDIVQQNTADNAFFIQNFATGVDDNETPGDPFDDLITTAPKETIKDETQVQYIIKEPEDGMFNTNYSNFDFNFADGFGGIDEDGTMHPEKDEFYSSFKTNKLNIYTDTEAARIENVGTDNEDGTFTFEEIDGSQTDDSFDFAGNIYNPDNLDDVTIKLNGKRTDNNNPSESEDVVIDTKIKSWEDETNFTNPNGNSIITAINLESNSSYKFTSVDLTSKDKTTTIDTSDSKAIFTTLPKNIELTNASWSNINPFNDVNNEINFGKANPILTFEIENIDKTDIQNVIIKYGENEIPLSLIDYQIVSFTNLDGMEIKDPTKTDYVYTDGSKGAENAIQSGKYSIRFDNLLPSNKTFNNIKISFDSNFKVDYPDGITSIDVTNQSENNLPDLSINKVISAGKQKTLSLIESGDTYATFEFEAYDPDLFESKNAVLTLSDGTKEIEREILNNDFKIIESPTRDLGNSTTYSFKIDGLSKLTTYTVKSFVFDDVNQEILGPIKFTTTKKPFPWWIIILIILLFFIAWLIYYFLPELNYQFNYYKELRIMKKEFKAKEAEKAAKLKELENK